MKTSFYFVLWIVVSLLIEILGNYGEYAFFASFAVVMILSGIINRMTEDQKEYIVERQQAAFFEIVYRNDYRRYLKMFRNRFLFAVASVVYFLIAIVFLLMIRENIIILAIFALCGFLNAKQLFKAYNEYSDARKAECIELSQETYDDYLKYKEARDAGYNVDQMYRPADWKDKLLRGSNFAFAILSILIGMFSIVFYLPGLLLYGEIFVGSAMLVAYGLLAFIYGINDLATSITGYHTDIK